MEWSSRFDRKDKVCTFRSRLARPEGVSNRQIKEPVHVSATAVRQVASLSYTHRLTSLTYPISIDVSIRMHCCVPRITGFRDAHTKDQGLAMDTVLIIILLLLLFGGGGGLYWGMGAGWGIGPIGLIIAVIVVAFLLNSRRGRL